MDDDTAYDIIDEFVLDLQRLIIENNQPVEYVKIEGTRRGQNDM